MRQPIFGRLSTVRALTPPKVSDGAHSYVPVGIRASRSPTVSMELLPYTNGRRGGTDFAQSYVAATDIWAVCHVCAALRLDCELLLDRRCECWEDELFENPSVVAGFSVRIL
jgi:hypothetical protein